MASYQRIALFVLFDSLERDLIKNIRLLIPASSSSKLLTQDETARAQDRIRKRGRDNLYDLDDPFDLLHGLDLGDKYAILMRGKSELSSADAEYFAKLKSRFDRAIPIRADVMHGRPLTVDDYSFSFALSNDLLKSPRYWPELTVAFNRISQEPEHLLQRVPTIIDDDPTEILNNLPRVDYDDTGFVPRPKLEPELKKKILGRHPVITVLGEGGNGKSALTLQTAYRLLSSSDHNFDAVMWVSAKSQILTPQEIIRIEAIADSLGIFESIAEFEPGGEDAVTRVQRLLSENEILLIIDNLETVLDGRMRKFAEDIPGKSKLVFTSRVPLGSDLSVVVGEFSPIESEQYLRRLIDAYSIESLRRMDSDQVQFYIKRLNYKPMLIKWFALGVSSGLSPNAIIRSPDLALRYCLGNVIDKLDDNAKLVALVFAHISGSHSALEVQYLSGLSAAIVEQSIAKLLQFALIEDNSKDSFERTYGMGTFARSYLTRIEKIKLTEIRSIVERHRKIKESYQSELGNTVINKYSYDHYTVRSRSETIAASQLRKAYRAADRGDVDGALMAIDALRISSPEYFEVYRVTAGIHVKAGDIQSAISAYETAIDVDPQQPQLYFWYGGFLMRWQNDFDRASEMFTEALTLDPISGAVLREAARNELFASRFDKAQELVDRAMRLQQKSFRDSVIFFDLQAQVYIRRASALAHVGDFINAISELESLKSFVESIDISYIDSTFHEHLEKAKRYCTPILLSRATGELENRIKSFLVWLEAFLSVSGSYRSLGSESREERNRTAGKPLIDAQRCYVGYLRKRGQQPSFGFLVAEEGIEVFVHKTSMPLSTWSLLKKGGSVNFKVILDGSGRFQASDIAPARGC
jgi:tetratricopeptide (TPR) repeat protein